MNRRESLTKLSTSFLALFLGGDRLLAGLPPTRRRMTVYKTPTCGCCSAWVKHVRASGFDVEEINVDDVMPYKRKLGVPEDLASCHTAVVGAYAFEGHVPADLIEKLMREAPRGVKGLAVPGMPVGSPGMEMGNRKDAYEVVAFKGDRSRSVYARR
jgi:hypothetical protein